MGSNGRFEFAAMGSACALHLPGVPVSVAHAAEAEVARIERRYSRYRDDSVLADLNRVAAAGGSLVVDEETAGLLDYAMACHRQSGGRFDITTGVLRRVWNFSGGRPPAAEEIARWLPLVGWDKIRWERPRLSFPVPGMELDFGGIGKEYAADRAAEVCLAAGMTHGLIDLGGDLRAFGPQPDGSPWTVDIRNPQASGHPLATIKLACGGLATSGDYERCIVVDGVRLGHILDPLTGWPTRGLASVSVVAHTCLLAGSLATIAMLKGAAGPGWLAELGVRGVWLDVDGCKGDTAAMTTRTT